MLISNKVAMCYSFIMTVMLHLYQVICTLHSCSSSSVLNCLPFFLSSIWFNSHNPKGYEGSSRSWSYGSWIYNYLCNQCQSPLKLRFLIPLRAKCTTLCDKVCQWLAAGQCFSPGTPVSSTNKTDCHDITEILLKVTLSTIKLTKDHFY